MATNLRGVMAALLTPFDQQQALDKASLRQLYCCHFFIRRNHCTAAGCRRDTDRSI